MPIVSVRNVSVLRIDGMENGSNLRFEHSPGNVVSESTPADSEIDGTDCTIMAGLIDAKVDTHGSTQALGQFVAYGVTTVVDSSSASSHGEAMRLAAEESSTAPSFLFCSTTMVSAHGASLAMFPFQSVKRVATRNEAIEYVESAIRRDGGADFFKVVLDQPGLDVEIIAAATTTAQRLGKLVMGHASQVAAYRLALQTGCDMVTPVPLDGPLDEDMVRELAQRGIGVIPTLAFLRKAVTEGRMPQVAYEHAKTAVRALRQAGVSVCAGSSSNPCSENGEVAVAHGSGLMEELHLLEVDGGMTRPELLRAATSAPAALFRLADRGVIAEGRRADMLLVRGSPLEGAGLSNRILKVWVAGVEV